VWQLYNYVGPPEIAEAVRNLPAGTPIRSPQDLKNWVESNRTDADGDGVIAATFVVDRDGVLRLAPRRTEHVACASGGPVMSAGELFFRQDLSLADASNQSTGFCPEPTSWPAIAAALSPVVASVPEHFSRQFTFRRCPSCGQILVIKDDWFVCDVCDADVPDTWNFE
jgi:hypothetical protein